MRVSAVIPAYNSAGYLPEAIASILAQTSPVDEIIVVDDGSTDDTAAVLARFGDAVRCIRQTNQGASAARNNGIRAATGEWIAFLDADDCWLPDKIRLQRAALQLQPDAILIYTSFWTVNAKGERWKQESPEEQTIARRLLCGNPFATPTLMVRKDVLLDAGGFNERLRTCEDWELWMRISQKGRFAQVPDLTTVCQEREGSLTGDPRRLLEDFEAILEPVLLKELSFFQRMIWRRRARSVQLFSAAMTARKIGKAADERSYLVKSILMWPSLFWRPIRYKALGHVLLRSAHGGKRSGE